MRHINFWEMSVKKCPSNYFLPKTLFNFPLEIIYFRQFREYNKIIEICYFSRKLKISKYN